MGEVYRADDLKLGQPVALKFLPEAVQRDRARLELFLNEVRLGLKVSHPNVCRVYDLGEADNHHFISMEYVDGEDLAALLRRIGRLPRDKALQIARQLCAGLAAAHEQGVLHRDLKPANVMLDGRGRAKITDFGLAGLAGGGEDEIFIAGTPGYMAPEYIAGELATTRSDIYCLGLVLYEIFTGKRAFEGSSRSDLLEKQLSSSPSSPSSHVDGLDRAVERTIMRCIERDPSRRPESVLAVSAALPGGDPLAAALAAGDTPDPQLLADAGARGGLSRLAAWSCLGAALAGLTLAALAAARVQTPRRVPLPHPPEVLEAKASEILQALGHRQEPRDRVSTFVEDELLLEHIRRTDASPQRWSVLSTGYPPLIRFWYQQSPTPLVPRRLIASRYERGDPPLDGEGMAGVLLDAEGRLLSLAVVPPDYLQGELSPRQEVSGEPDWQPLFEAAGIDAANLVPVEPRARPAVAVDRRAAWTGRLARGTDVEVRIEAGAYNGRLVYFETLFPWQIAAATGERRGPTLERAAKLAYLLFRIVMVSLAALLARRNVRAGRVDLRGAISAALIVGVARFAVFLTGGHHVLASSSVRLLFGNLAWSLWYAFFVFIVYLAVEPYFRRTSPQQVVAWVRLLQRRAFDPLVGREVLFGVLWGVGLFLLRCLYHLVPVWLGRAPPGPGAFLETETALAALPGGRFLWHALSGSAVIAINFVALGVMFFVFLRLSLRSDRLALAVFIPVMAVMANQGAGNPAIDLLFAAVWGALGIFFLLRVGLLALTVGLFVEFSLQSVTLTLDMSTWYAASSLSVLLLVAALAIYGARFSLAGRPMIDEDALSGELAAGG